MTDQEIQYLMKQLQNQLAGGGGTSFRNRQLFDQFGPNVPPALLRNAPVGSDLRPNALPFTRPLMAASGNISGVMSTDSMSQNGYPYTPEPPQDITDRGPNAPPLNIPHEAMDVPTGVFPPATTPFQYQGMPTTINVPHQGIDVPSSVFAPPNIAPTAPTTFSPEFSGDWSGGPANPPPNENMFPTDVGFFPQDYPPDFSNIELPTDYQTQPFFQEDFVQDFPNAPAASGQDFNVTAPPATQLNEFLQPIPTDFVSAPPAAPGFPGGNPPFDPTAASTLFGAPPVSGLTSGTGMPDHLVNAPGPSMPFLDPNDPNNNLIRGGISMPLYPTSNDVFPGASGGGVGGFFKDAAGNIMDATGKIIASAADFAGKFGGSIANLAKSIPGAIQDAGQDFMNSLPQDSGGFGQPMGFFGIPNAPIPGTFGVNEPGVSRPGTGWAGTGITINDIQNSGVNPSYGNFAPGQVGRSSVNAPQSGMAFMGGGSRANVSALGGYNNRLFAEAEMIKRAIMTGGYRPQSGYNRYTKYPAPALTSSTRNQALSMGFVPVPGYQGAFARPGATPVNWDYVGQQWRNKAAPSTPTEGQANLRPSIHLNPRSQQ
jgi:hypothetical protein